MHWDVTLIESNRISFAKKINGHLKMPELSKHLNKIQAFYAYLKTNLSFLN